MNTPPPPKDDASFVKWYDYHCRLMLFSSADQAAGSFGGKYASVGKAKLNAVLKEQQPRFNLIMFGDQL